ncbi:MAG: amidohydrolase family protein, partial [Acidimicrobiales bacterium]
MVDLVIRNAQLVDGSGTPSRPADIVVDDGRITEVTRPAEASTTSARQVLDADGRLVTPGWVDVHTHYDAQVTWDPWVTPSSWHGVTTVVMGNCGVGFAPATADRHEWLIELMEGVEDIPGSAMTEGITWDWTSFPEYLDAVEGSARVLDVGAQIAHGPLRAFVMGERGAANEPATEADRTAMAHLVEEALGAGALGFSTSRTPLHRSKDGELVPGTSAAAEELLSIGDALRRAGHGVFQFAPDHARVPLEEWPWMEELARRSGRTVSVNLNQPDQDPEVWREVLRLLEGADADGLSIVAQVAGRSIGILYCLHGSVHPLLFHPAYAEVAHLPMPQRLAALGDPERRRRLVEDVPDDGGFFQRVVLDKVGRMWLVDGPDIDYEPDASTSVASVAAARA